jgi:hypothetical protein
VPFSVFANVVIMVVYAPGHRGRIWNPFSKKNIIVRIRFFLREDSLNRFFSNEYIKFLSMQSAHGIIFKVLH